MGFVAIYKSKKEEPKVKPVNCSNKVIKTYELQYDKDHLVKVVCTGEVNFYEKIQAHAGDVDFNKILKIIEMTGDPFQFSCNAPSNIDMTNVPKNATEVMQANKKAKEMEVKLSKSDYFKKQGVSFEEFVKKFNAKDFIDYMNQKSKETKEVKGNE